MLKAISLATTFLSLAACGPRLSRDAAECAAYYAAMTKQSIAAGAAQSYIELTGHDDAQLERELARAVGATEQLETPLMKASWCFNDPHALDHNGS